MRGWCLVKKGLFPTALLALAARAFADIPLAELDARFSPVDAPVCMQYEVGYRLMNIELSQVAKVEATTTIGTWNHRVTGEKIPALFLDMRVDSPDNGIPGHRNRISIHDRIVAVLTVPGMQALVFAKATDESLRPLIRTSEMRATSVYDTQSGRLEYEYRNLKNGAVVTNLANPEALLELSRRVYPVMQFLVEQYGHPTPDAATSDNGRIVANIDGKVAALRIQTHGERSPSCLARQRLQSMCIRPVAERGSTVRPRDFQAWSVSFDALAGLLGDAALREAADRAPAKTVVPLVMDYELALGVVRVTMKSVHVGRPEGGGAPRLSGGEKSKTGG